MMLMPMKNFITPFRLESVSDRAFLQSLALMGSLYVILIIGMIFADISEIHPRHMLAAFSDKEIQYAVKLSLFSCFVTALLSVLTAVPLAYLLARVKSNSGWFHLFEVLLDVPFVMPPVVIGLSLLLLFNSPAGHFLERYFSVSYAIPGVIIAQFPVACALALRVMRTAFERLDPRQEKVALTLGCSQRHIYWRIALPQVRKNILAAFTLAWSRALGEFGPVMIFAGTIRMQTEVLPTSVYFELNMGHTETAVAISLLMILLAVLAMGIVRLAGMATPAARQEGV